MHLALSTRAANCFRVAASSLLILAPLHRVGGQADTEVLTNATVVQMVAGKLSRDIIISKINAARPGFDLSADGIVGLWSNRVDQSVIKLMLTIGETARRKGEVPKTLVGLDEVLNNDAVVRMVVGKLPKQLILQKLQMSRSAFDVSATGLVNLNASKVPEDVIKVMMAPPPPPPPVNPTPIPVREAPADTAKSASKPAAKDTASKSAAGSKKPAAKTPPPPVKKPPESGVDL